MSKHGIVPIEFNVLVRPETVEEKTAGGIILTAESKESDQAAVQEGVIVEKSIHAFTYEEWPKGARIPMAGDRVSFTRYAGGTIKGNDDEEYRLIKDKDIQAILEKKPDEA